MDAMSKPLVSVIIPTAGRPQWLPRAVSSCLDGMPPGSVEVIVVPNGGDQSWRQALAPWAASPHVRIYPSPEPNQNIARNLGLSHADGELVRFLDDDDYLLPDGAARQHEAMRDGSIDVCSGNAERVDLDGNRLGTLTLPATEDFTVAALHRRRLQLPFAHVYRRSTLDGLEWPVEMLRSEDIAFLIRYATAAPRKWAIVDRSVGVWFQHDSPRMSLDRPASSVNETTATELFGAFDALNFQNRMTPQMARVIADALWECIHRGLFLRPVYWTRVARKTMEIDAAARPDTVFFRNAAIRRLDPVLVHWVLLPARQATYAWRSLRARFVGRDYRRQL